MAATPILGFCTCMMALVTAICALSAALTHHWVVVESGGGEGTNGVSNQTFYWGLSHECFDSTCTQLEYTPVATCTRSSADVEERYDVVLGFIVVGFLFAFFTGGLSIFASFRIKSQEHRRSIARGEIEGVTMALSKLKQLREAEEVLSKRIIGIAILSGLSLLSFIVGMILFADATNSYTFCQNACDHFRSVMVGVTSCGYGSSYLLGVAATICSVVMFIFGIIFFGIYKSGESTRWNGVADFSDLEKTRTPYGDEVRSLGSMRSGRKSRRPKRRSPAPEATQRSTPQPSSSENAKQRGLPPAAASENTEPKQDSREEEKEDPPALKYQLTTYSAVGDGEDQQQQQSNGNRQKAPQPYEEKREQEKREERKKKEEEEQRRKEVEDERQRRRRDAEAQQSRDEERAKEEEMREAKRQEEEKRRKEEDERRRKEERRIEEDNERRRREEEEAAQKQAAMKEESPQPSPERNQPQPTQQQTPPPAAAANSSYNPLDRTQSSAAGSPAGAGNNNNKILSEHRGIIENLQGNDWCWSADHELYWSDEEKLFFDPESCNFYDPDKEQWYDPESGEWYTLDE